MLSGGIFKQSMGARNRVGIGLSYRPVRLHMLAELIPWNRFLGLLKVQKFGLRLVSEEELKSDYREYQYNLNLRFSYGSYQGVTKRCRLSWLTNSNLVYEPNCRERGGEVTGSQPMSAAVQIEPK